MMKSRYWLLIFSGVYLALSIALYFSVSSDTYRYEMDSGAYTDYVDRLNKFGTFHDPHTVHTQNVPHISVGYPLFLWLIRTIFGNRVFWIVFAQVLLALGIIVETFYLAYQLFSKNIALVVAGLLSINIGLLVYPQFILAEIFLAFLLLAGFKWYVHGLLFKRPRAYILSGIFFGYSMVVKPVALYFVPLLLCYTLWYMSWRRGMRSVLLFGSIWMIPVVAYSSYHYVTYGSYTLSGAQSTNMYYYFLPKVLSRVHHISLENARSVVRSCHSSDENLKVNKLYALLKNTVVYNLVIAIQVWLEQVTRTVFGLYATQLKVLLYGHPPHGRWYSFWRFSGSWWQKLKLYITFNVHDTWMIGVGVYELGYIILRTFCVLWFMGILVWRRCFVSFILCGLYVGYFALISGHDGCGRFRMMCEPVLTILCAGGIVYWYQLICQYVRAKQRKRV